MFLHRVTPTYFLQWKETYAGNSVLPQIIPETHDVKSVHWVSSGILLYVSFYCLWWIWVFIVAISQHNIFMFSSSRHHHWINFSHSSSCYPHFHFQEYYRLYGEHGDQQYKRYRLERFLPDPFLVSNRLFFRQDLESRVKTSDKSPPEHEEYYVYRRFSR